MSFDKSAAQKDLFNFKVRCASHMRTTPDRMVASCITHEFEDGLYWLIAHGDMYIGDALFVAADVVQPHGKFVSDTAVLMFRALLAWAMRTKYYNWNTERRVGYYGNGITMPPILAPMCTLAQSLVHRNNVRFLECLFVQLPHRRFDVGLEQYALDHKVAFTAHWLRKRALVVLMGILARRRVPRDIVTYVVRDHCWAIKHCKECKYQVPYSEQLQCALCAADVWCIEFWVRHPRRGPPRYAGSDRVCNECDFRERQRNKA